MTLNGINVVKNIIIADNVQFSKVNSERSCVPFFLIVTQWRRYLCLHQKRLGYLA